MVGSEKRSHIEIANDEVSIYTVLSKAEVDFGAYFGTTAKLYCPFGAVTHFDGGAERALRVYPNTNSAYCFACSQYFDPVGLYAELKDISRTDAADALLDESDWVPDTYEDKWDALMTEPNFDSSYLVEALNMYCRRIQPDWALVRFDEPYISAFAKCEVISDKVTNQQQADHWLDTCKEYMKRVLT